MICVCADGLSFVYDQDFSVSGILVVFSPRNDKRDSVVNGKCVCVIHLEYFALLGSMCVPKTMMIYSLGAHGALLHEGSVAIISGCGCSA